VAYKGTPAVIILYIAAAALLIALGMAANEAGGMFGGKSQLLAEPSAVGINGTGIGYIEDFLDEYSTLVTYEIRRQSSARAVRQGHNMTVIGTNSVYAAVMGYPITDGGFFTGDAYRSGAREAVLNELAAAALFGGGRLYGSPIYINGELWTVVGVMIDDGDAENIYVPATSELMNSAAGASGQGAAAGSLMVLLKGYGAAEAATAVNNLKNLGVTENSYTFKRLGKAAASLGEMADVALRFALALLLFAFGWRSALAAYRIIGDAYAASVDTGVHAPDSRGKARVLRAAVHIVLLIACAAAFLALARRIVEICVTWQEIPPVFLNAPPPQGDFYGRLEALGEIQAKILGLFTASIITSAAAQIAAAFAFRER